MKILVNKKIKSLFCKITACIMLFTLSATLLTIFEVRPTVLVIFLCMIGNSGGTDYRIYFWKP